MGHNADDKYNIKKPINVNGDSNKTSSDNFIELNSQELKVKDEETANALKEIPEDVVLRYEGIGNRRKLEKVPEFNSTNSEKVLRGEGTNSWIVLGRDRPSSPATGYGGIGATQCGAIDLCVGRVGDWKTIAGVAARDGAGARPSRGSAPKRKLVADNDFVRDAARIYISERSDIDDYFGIAAGKAGGLNGLSGIAVKADSVRIIGREGIKLVTRTDENNSKGGNADVIMGIDLIAGNDDSDLQPMVKGENLRDLLRYMVEDIRSLTSMIHSISLKQSGLETMLTAHSHPSAGAISFPSPELGIYCGVSQVQRLTFDVPAQLKKVFENITLEIEFLKPYGDQYICSYSNHTN
jgi:hypothetical protein